MSDKILIVEDAATLRDSPCQQVPSRLPDATQACVDSRHRLAICDAIHELKADYTIMVVTHTVQQAARASDYTAFFTVGQERTGYLVEFGKTSDIFTNPRNELTEQYITGRLG